MIKCGLFSFTKASRYNETGGCASGTEKVHKGTALAPHDRT